MGPRSDVLYYINKHKEPIGMCVNVILAHIDCYAHQNLLRMVAGRCSTHRRFRHVLQSFLPVYKQESADNFDLDFHYF